ncbi:hypothetical protein BJ138DRAFT_628028 [Hygrophoropsis aurantiaca]|uniref:Uncharacterized protein n=1 Tax=Hygrophoropsis aurantiaca TaxID=72124 RepID=A0ACB7ZZL9_9AGAM|nr:hypothetical protein BJ138DRAFT_628028 [Hygrophoropsis aurantiaca]
MTTICSAVNCHKLVAPDDFKKTGERYKTCRSCRMKSNMRYWTMQKGSENWVRRGRGRGRRAGMRTIANRTGKMANGQASRGGKASGGNTGADVVDDESGDEWESYDGQDAKSDESDDIVVIGSDGEPEVEILGYRLGPADVKVGSSREGPGGSRLNGKRKRNHDNGKHGGSDDDDSGDDNDCTDELAALQGRRDFLQHIVDAMIEMNTIEARLRVLRSAESRDLDGSRMKKKQRRM